MTNGKLAWEGLGSSAEDWAAGSVPSALWLTLPACHPPHPWDFGEAKPRILGASGQALSDNLLYGAFCSS
jgi:hypothetical protein